MPTLIFLDAEALLRMGGILLVCLLVFASVGMFFCFFLPIGGVLFTVGILTATGALQYSIHMVCSLLIFSSFFGSLVGYGIGRSTGNYFYTRKDSRFFRRSYLDSTEIFYNKHGAIAIMGGYFLPVIRAFTPVLAGIIKVKFTRFFCFSLVGSIVFIGIFVLTGYLVGSLPFLKPWIKYIVAGFILIVTIPLFIKIIRQLKKPTGD